MEQLAPADAGSGISNATFHIHQKIVVLIVKCDLPIPGPPSTRGRLIGALEA